MTVKNVEKDPASLTMVITTEFGAPIDRVWQLWADPRQLERWWGPPTYPATFVDHEFVPGSKSSYFMTSPEGDKYHGWWRIVAVDAPNHLELLDGFADETGAANPDLPVTAMRVGLTEQAGLTTMVMTSTFPSLEAMDQIMAMGMEEGIRAALGQIDDIIAA
jgi:uncharacterized protein YndB with AHSA1/START domain